MGLTVGDGALMDPPAGAGRLIEVIGDSISCGYGNLGTLADTECFTTESHWDTYEVDRGARARRRGQHVAASGRGIIRNYGGDTGGTMPMLYERDHREPRESGLGLPRRAAGGRHQPGDQRHQQQQGRSRHRFPRHVHALLQTIRAYYPHTFIVCIIAPLLNGGELATIGGHIRAAVEARNAAGDANVEFFDQIPAQTSDKYACQYHPNVAENMLMADMLVGELARSSAGSGRVRTSQ